MVVSLRLPSLLRSTYIVLESAMLSRNKIFIIRSKCIEYKQSESRSTNFDLCLYVFLSQKPTEDLEQK